MANLATSPHYSKLAGIDKYDRFHDLPVEIDDMLTKEAEAEGLPDVLEKLLMSFRTIGSGIRDGVFTSFMTGSTNLFGDQQLDVDLQAEEVSCTQLLTSSFIVRKMLATNGESCALCHLFDVS
jgi:fructose-1,6-bisphosphatase